MTSLNDPLIEAVEAFRASDERSAERLEWDVIRPCWSQFTRIANFMSSQGVLGSLVGDREIISSFIMEATWELLCSTKPSVAMPANIPSSAFIPIMRRRVAQMVRAYSMAHPTSGLSGTSAVNRRRMALAAHQRRLTKTLGYTPDIDDAMESYNDYLLATRKDPSKQGALVTHENLALASVTLTEDFTAAHEPRTDDDVARDEVDLGLISREIAERAREQGPLVEQVAFELLDLAATGDALVRAGVIAERIGAERTEVQDAIACVQQITIEVLDHQARSRGR